MNRSFWKRLVVSTLACMMSIAVGAAWAADDASIRGTVVDPLGARVSAATVKLLLDGKVVKEGASDAEGAFTFDGLASGRYQLEVGSPGFQVRTTEPMFVAAGERVSAEVALPIGPLEQSVSVTAAATDVLPSQIGAPVTVLDSETLNALNKVDVLESLRLVPGAQVVQTGARGGTAALYIRGGNSNFTKLLVDGIPANDIGGAVDFATLSTSGVDRLEVLRETNSVVNGSDSLAGVISLTTRRGTTRTPLAEYTLDGGNLNTVHNDISAGGAVNRFDYFGNFSRFTTDNSQPNNKYRNNTFATRLGLALGHGSQVTGTVRWIDGRVESPNGLDFYAIPDDSFSTSRTLLAGVGLQSQINDRWQTSIRFGGSSQQQEFDNPTPTGESFDPFGSGENFLGKTVTLRGANGYSVTGQAILDFGGAYPSVFTNKSTRNGLYGQTTYHVATNFDLSGGAHYEHEAGFSDPDADPTLTRDNGGAFVEGRGTLGGRISVTAGLGFEHNEAFKNAATPRISVAAFLRTPSEGKAFLGDTRVTFNAGKGIKAPAISQEQSSLFSLLAGTPSAGAVSPIGPERSRTFDVGLEQGLWGGRARARVAYFNNDYSDLIEFVSSSVLPQLGIPQAVATAAGFGAYVNSQSYTSKGAELSFDALIAARLRLAASYTYTDSEVTESLSGGVLAPAVNPAFPDIEIGQFSPLVGQRPFRRPTNLGSMLVSYTEGPAQVTLAGYFAGHADDSTFLSDGFFGFSMLLPNRDLDDSYQKIDLSGSYRVNSHLRGFISIENLLDQHYESAFGFANLPRVARAGITISVGGR